MELSEAPGVAPLLVASDGVTSPDECAGAASGDRCFILEQAVGRFLTVVYPVAAGDDDDYVLELRNLGDVAGNLALHAGGDSSGLVVLSSLHLDGTPSSLRNFDRQPASGELAGGDTLTISFDTDDAHRKRAVRLRAVNARHRPHGQPRAVCLTQ